MHAESYMNRLQKEQQGSGELAITEFPGEAFDYHDEVTPEAIEKLRAKAAAKIGDRKRWKQTDGFGRVVIPA